MSMTRLVVSLSLLVALVAAVAYFAQHVMPGGKGAGDGYAVYENADYGLKAEYPAKWQMLEDVRGVVVVFHSPLESTEDRYNDNVNVIVEDVSGHSGMTADAYAESGLAKLPAALADFRLVGSRSETLSGRPARVIEYTGRKGEFRLHFLQAVTVAGGNAYLITYAAEETSYAKYLPVARRIMASMAIK
jgi:serine/threonine-protein kinase